MRCFLVKANVVPLPTFAYNEGTIIGIVNIFRIIATQLGLTNEIVSNKVVMIKGDLFTV